MIALVTVLAQAYSDPIRGLAPLQRAGIAREMLHANQAARPFWEQSLDLAERLGLLQRVVDIATTDPTIAAFHRPISLAYEAHLAEQAAAGAADADAARPWRPRRRRPRRCLRQRRGGRAPSLHATRTGARWTGLRRARGIPRRPRDDRSDQLGKGGAVSAPVTAEELAEVERITAGPPRHWKPLELSTARTLLPRLASDLADARHDLDTERKALSLLGDRCLDLGRELEALRAAVRAHEAAAARDGRRPTPGTRRTSICGPPPRLDQPAPGRFRACTIGEQTP